MPLNLEKLRAEIDSYLESNGIAIFRGASAGYDDDLAVYWDTEGQQDYRAFIGVAQAAGVPMVAMYAEQFDEEVIDEALERLAGSGITGSERAALERRLREMRRYDGATCQIEMSFDHAPRTYVFDLRADWFRELGDILDRIDDAVEDGGLEEPPGAGYFSKN
jgi:hypothetical protein